MKQEDNKKKILIVASVISFIEWFNKENVEYLCNNLKCEVHIACNCNYFKDTDEQRTIEYIEKEKLKGIIFFNIPFARSPFDKKNIEAYRLLKELINREKYTLVHCHTPVASILTRFAARKARQNGTAVMYTCHGFHFHKKAPIINWIIYFPIEKFCSRFCDYIVTINMEDYKIAKSFHAKNVRYIPGVGVDLKRIENVKINKVEYRRKLGIPEDAFVIISVGEIIERKNHEVIIRAMEMLRNDDIYYVICGKGPLKEYLQKLAEKFGLQNQVRFLGFRTDVAELYHMSDISAFPSKIEGLGLAGIEAMAAGIPLVASNVHGILDYVVDGESGYACDPKAAKSFAEKIDILRRNKNLREKMINNGMKKIDKYEINNALRAMWDIYDEVIN